MSGLTRLILGRPKSTQLAGFHVQSSVYGVPITIVYGMTRVAGNLIHMPKNPVLQNSTQSKTTRATKGASGGDVYVAPVVISLGEGPIAGINHVWRDKDGIVTYTGNYDVNGWTLKLGSISQAAWSYLSTNFSAQAVPYQFTAYVANDSTPLPSDSLSQYSWEVQGFLPFQGFGVGQIADALPIDILNDLLTNTRYGVGFGTAQIANITTAQDYCAAASLFCSPAIDNQRPGADWVNELCEVGNLGPVWSDGTLKFIPYGDVPLSGNGHTYTPNTTPLYDLTDSDFLPRGGDLDPIQVSRTDPATACNQVQVEYRDRDLDYNNTTQTAQDQYAIDAYGVAPLPPMQLHSITRADVAQQVGQMRLQREQNVRNTYAFRLGWRFSLLEPMDLVTLTDAGLGLSKTPVRIVEITEGADEKGFDVIAEEWPFGTASATLYTTPTPGGLLPNANVDPGNTATPTIVEAPTALKTSPLDLLIAASGGANWGGCDVYISTDNSNFTKVGRIIGAAAMGTLTGTLATSASVWPATDGVNTLAVDISASRRSLASYSATDFANLVPSCYVGGEWCAFETAALTGPGTYNLTTLYRALYNSAVGSHGAGAKFFLLDGTIGRVPWPQGKAGETVYFKLPAFNIYGGALQDVASVSSTSYAITGDPTPFQNAVPQGTMSIDANGVTSASADGPSIAQSYRWADSTSAFPVDATVAASGTIVNGRSFSLTAFRTLTFAQTDFLTIVPFTAANGNGQQLPSIHLRGSYQSFSATKTVAFSRASFLQTYQTGTGPWAPTYDTVGSPTSPAMTTTGLAYYTMMIELPVGVSLVSASFDGVWSAAATPLSSWSPAFYKAATLINNGFFSSGGGAQTVTFSLSGTVSANQALMLFSLWAGPLAGAADVGQAVMKDVYVTYSMPTPDKGI